DLANYLLKDPYIFDLAGTKEHADERDIEEQLVNHVTKYLLEIDNWLSRFELWAMWL
ncbi:hypothetical protein EZS27_034126, partial [termite gut metagenome]